MNDEFSRGYYAIIPAFIRYDTDIPANAKLLYAEITALSNEKGYCWASNDYFAKLYNVSKRSIISWIKSLAKKGYIDIEIIYKENSKEIDSRILKLPSEENFTPYGKNLHYPSEENFTDNNININNKINNIKKENIKEKKEEELKRAINEILDYYNNCCDYNSHQFTIKKHFKISINNKNAVKLIKQRLKDGYTIDDFKDVIFIKYLDFVENGYLIKGRKTIYYYRPSTLFSSENFEKYKNEYEFYCQGDI